MKKIIITRNQLDETMFNNIPNNGGGLADKTNSAIKWTNDNGIPSRIGVTTGNPNTITVVAPKNGMMSSNDLGKIERTKGNIGAIYVVPNTSSTESVSESVYSKRRIEETMDKFNKTMTKRELEESWNGDSDMDFNRFIEKYRENTAQTEYHYELSLHNYTDIAKHIEAELMEAMRLIKSGLEDCGLKVTGTKVFDYGDDFNIEVYTDWNLKSDEWTDDEDDWKKYNYLKNIGKRELGTVRISMDDNANWRDNTKPVNPYFTISSIMPKFGDE